MRIGYFIPGWPPDKVPNGIAATLGRLSEALEKLGHEVFFLTPQFMAERPDPRVFVIKPEPARGLLDRLRWKLDPENTFFETSAMAIRSHLRQLISAKGIELFQMEESFGWVNTVADGLPIPVVTRLHGPWFTYAGISYAQTPLGRNKNRIEKEGLAIRSAFAVTAPSHSVLRSTTKFYGDITGACKVIPNPMPPCQAENTWNYRECDKSMILFVGRFDEHKGGDIVIQAFSELVKLRPEMKLTFVGPDNGVKMEDGRVVHFWEFVRAKVPTQAADRITYLGPQPRSQIDSLRRTAALTVVSSRYETFGNVVVEAMAVGCPIVATNVGGIAEILENERNALLVEPGSPNALVSACRQLLEKPKLAIRLSNQSRRDCANRYHPEKIAKQTIKFYSTVIDQFSQHAHQNKVH